jgi:amidohydrolase
VEAKKLKKKIQEEVEVRREELINLSLKIHENPELSWKEEKASSWLADYLEKNGFKLERGLYDLSTAFRASYGDGKPTIAILAEYDALPGVGHGCGHNIIAAIAVGAGVAAKSLADDLGVKILVMGCPAEELLGGKVVMVEKGTFKGVDVAMMVHPGGDQSWAGFRTTANIFLDVEFWGKEAHAAADPWNGISALEALLLAFNNINSLRLHVKDGARISGIITDGGGKAANVIPKHAAGTFMIRACEDAYLDELREKVLTCFKGASMGTGARLEYCWGLRCAAMRSNSTILQFWRNNMEALGRNVDEIANVSGSTDMGNVGLTVPSIHPFISISSQPVVFHSAEFAAASVSNAGKKAVIDGAKALAMTAVDIASQRGALSRIKEEFAQMRKQL